MTERLRPEADSPLLPLNESIGVVRALNIASLDVSYHPNETYFSEEEEMAKVNLLLSDEIHSRYNLLPSLPGQAYKEGALRAHFLLRSIAESQKVLFTRVTVRDLKSYNATIRKDERVHDVTDPDVRIVRKGRHLEETDKLFWKAIRGMAKYRVSSPLFFAGAADVYFPIQIALQRRFKSKP